MASAPLAERIEETAAALRARLAVDPALTEPRLVLVLGSGLGGVVDLLDSEPRIRIPYGELPNVPTSGIPSHAGEVVAGLVAGRPVLVLSGRAHGYEGYSPAEVTILLRATFRLGVATAVLTNAAGGLSAEFGVGDLMIFTDHINWSGRNPLTGPNVDALGSRFPAMVDAYDADLAYKARAAARAAGIRVRQGVYLMLPGPSFETRAEMDMLIRLGADAVGMSTVDEVIVARHAGVRVLAISNVTNIARPEVPTGATHEEVMEMGRIGAARLISVLRILLPDIA